MFLAIYNPRSGENELLRRLAPRESLDTRFHARRWVERATDGEAQASFSEPGSRIPYGCGDYDVEIRRTKAPTGSCWHAESFFVEWEEI